ncbi:MAG: hypothetical protein ACO3LE_00390 [Bdellovibrionota bacterium]
MRGFFQIVFALIFIQLPVQLEAQEFLKKLITQSPGPLSKSHAEYDTLKGCSNCHINTLGGDLDNAKCMDCHLDIKVRIEKNWGYHAGKTECSSCHMEHEGLDFDIFAPENWLDEFNHEKDTGYPLRGQHAKTECYDCHTTYREHYKTKAKTETRSYLNAPTTCYECHQDDYQHEFKDKKLLECTQCHSTGIENWKRLRKKMPFNHDTTRYKLEGLHKKVECSECHEPDPKTKRVTTFAPLEFDQCTDCHSDPHKGSFGNECTNCHSVYRKWDHLLLEGQIAANGFDHSKTKFPLEGYHEAVECESCHYQDKKSFKVPADQFDQCSDCHGDYHNGQFADQSCESCHSPTRKFYDSSFDLERHAKTEFPLDGKHMVIDCQQCHFTGSYTNLKFDECSDCHRNVHPEREIDQSCSFCHVTTSFSWIQFDHNKNTDFALTGEHREVACLSCHVDQVFKNMPANNDNPNCQSCHADPHGSAMSNECSSCHVTEGFKQVKSFKHEEIGRWKLTGRHTELSCQKCHENHLLGDYQVKLIAGAKLATECVNCHYDVHQGEMGSNCESCHSTNSFELEYAEKVHDLGFFKLEGFHDQLECSDCHATNNNLQGTGEFCAWCHEKDDIHLGQMGNTCGDCHYQTSWLPTHFQHNTTGFRLTGIHRYLECSSCHVNNIYQGLPSDCFFCHSDSFVPHIPQHSNASGRNVANCENCHVPIDWNIRRGSALP